MSNSENESKKGGDVNIEIWLCQAPPLLAVIDSEAAGHMTKRCLFDLASHKVNEHFGKPASSPFISAGPVLFDPPCLSFIDPVVIYC